AHKLVRLRYPDRFGDAWKILEVTGVNRALISGYADRGSSRAGHRVRAEAERLDRPDDFLYLIGGRIGSHHNKHLESSRRTIIDQTIIDQTIIDRTSIEPISI